MTKRFTIQHDVNKGSLTVSHPETGKPHTLEGGAALETDDEELAGRFEQHGHVTVTEHTPRHGEGAPRSHEAHATEQHAEHKTPVKK
jgi:hypothetical protein